MGKFILAMAVILVMFCGCSTDKVGSAGRNSGQSRITESGGEALDSDCKFGDTASHAPTEIDEATYAEIPSETAAAQVRTEGIAGTAAADETKPVPNPAVTEPPVISDGRSADIVKAQELYDKACRTEWNFHVGCPYSIDFSSSVTGNYGWDFYEITDSRIKSFADVERDYYKVFSPDFGNDLDEIYMEQGGKVYALAADRGANMYYFAGNVKELVSEKPYGDGKLLTFKVEVIYDGNDFTNDQIREQHTFSVVVSADGTWRAGEFTMPY